MSIANMSGSRGTEIGETSRSLTEVAESSGRITSDDLRKAQDLVRKLPSPETIKLLTQQCKLLRTKLLETLDFMQTVERPSTRFNPARYSKVFHEFRAMAQRVKIFLDACCHDDDDKGFVLAAIGVSAHKERFVKYHVELDWLIFLVDCIKEATRTHGPVSSSTRGRLMFKWKWKEKAKSLLKDTSEMIKSDFNHLNRLLEQHVRKTGDHQKICVTLLRRFGNETVQHHEAHGVPLNDLGRFIGSGADGVVFEFEWKGTVFAVKELICPTQDPNREVEILEKCSHPNIANLILAFRNRSGKQCHMMERLSMDLLKYVEKERHPGERPLEYLKYVDLMLQIGEGMLYLSEERHPAVSHRDLKPGNILVNLKPAGPEEEGQVVELQVADFGRAKMRAELAVDSRNTPNVGTTIYRAPELSRPPGVADKINQTSLKADVYSFGMTCSFLLTGREPFLENTQTRKHVRRVVGHPLPGDCPPELSSLLKRCCNPQPGLRPTSFSLICEELRNLKAQLLTDSDEPAATSDSRRKIDLEEPSDSCDVPLLRILVLGDSKAVNEAVNSVCDRDDFCDNLDDHMTIKFIASPPMRLYYTKKHGNSVQGLSNIKTFVAKRNKRWHHSQVTKAWKRDLIKLNKNPAQFPDSHKRLHLVWFVCTTEEEIPDWLRWKEITNELCGLPVQVLVTNDSYTEILQKRLWFNFDLKNQKLENLLMQVRLEEAEERNRLWRSCWEVKNVAEIANAAALMATMRKELGPNGIVVPVNIVTREDRPFSLWMSKLTFLSFLLCYWEISGNFKEVLLDRIRAEPKSRFEVFCLQNAAFILYNKRVHRSRGLYDAAVQPSLQFLSEEAAECVASYFKNMTPAAYNKKAEHILAFLLAVFEGKEYCPSETRLNWRSKVLSQASNCIRKLGANGRKS